MWRINTLPSGFGNFAHRCWQNNQIYGGVGMIMRLGTDGPNSNTRNSQSMAPIVFLGAREIFICVHNRTNPNENRINPNSRNHDVCGDVCNFHLESYIGMRSTGSFLSLTLILNI